MCQEFQKKHSGPMKRPLKKEGEGGEEPALKEIKLKEEETVNVEQEGSLQVQRCMCHEWMVTSLVPRPHPSAGGHLIVTSYADGKGSGT